MVGGLILLPATFVLAGPVYQPPGTKLTYGDVTHGQRVQSASSNPAAAAADLARGPNNRRMAPCVNLHRKVTR